MVVEHEAGGEAFAGGLGEFAEAAEVGGSDAGGGFHFEADELAVGALDHDIDLVLLFVTKVEKLERAVVGPARELEGFGEDEGLEERAEGAAVGGDAGGREAAQRREEAGVEEVKLGGFDEALELVGEPRGQRADEEELLEESDVFLHGRV